MWSKLVDFGIGIVAKDYYDLNRCQYHNWQHILYCYDYLESRAVPYSQDLDFAVLHHDIIYDNKPHKEARSAEFVLKKYPDMLGAIDPIMATVDHSIRHRGQDSRWMIRADLHQLADVKMVLKNYVAIMNESVDLYKIDICDFAKNNLSVMQSLKNTMYDNYAVDNDTFWIDVIKGIDLTIDISSAVIKHA
jgi:hypothetical protein